MSDDQIKLRTSAAFKKNTRELVKELFECGLIDTKDLSSYVRDAIIEKRNRDHDRIIALNEAFPVKSA